MGEGIDGLALLVRIVKGISQTANGSSVNGSEGQVAGKA